MNAEHIINQLANNADVFAALFHGAQENEALRKPAPDKWSLLDVLNHLADEERVDFRQRLDLTLHHPDKDWPGIDPEAAVKAPHYTERSLSAALADFLAERKHSIQWLRLLESPDWSQEHHHPRFGSMAAGTLLVSWLAHDYLHIRQITRLRYEALGENASPYSVKYAG